MAQAPIRPAILIPSGPTAASAVPYSFNELLALDGENTAEAVDFEDATRTITAYLRDNLLGVENDDVGKKILAAPIEHRIAGTDEIVKSNDRVFPNQPDLRYIKFMLPSISMLFFGSGIDEYWAGKAKYKVFDPETRVFKIRRLSKTYIRTVQITGWWRSPIERDRMTQQLLKLFQVSQNTGRLTTKKGSHIFMEYQDDKNIDDQDNIIDRIYQNTSTWELKVRGFVDEEYGQVDGIRLNSKKLIQ